MAVFLKSLYSIINNKLDAKDNERAFTFIEFIKEFGFDNSSSSFLNQYKEYLSLWSKQKEATSNISDKEFIKNSLVDTLKSIVLTYSSYEEQDFIANIDWNNDMHKKAIIPFFAEKIKNICDFYKTKRQETHLIINKNSFKGSKVSLEQIIYDKILDFYFDNRNLKPQIAHLQNNLSITIEQYIDIYSDYFDIPRHKKCTDKSRAKLIEANINNVNYEDYIKLAKAISEILYSGEVYLEEIPLIAQVGLDLSQQCAGDVETLRDTLLNQATINQVSLNDQVNLRRRLYQKYLGCDLYYIYCNTKNDVYIDLLTKADNPSGNLLNCGNADIAVIESDNIKLASNIGLFFKPDKTGILKVNADNFSWEVDKSKLTEDTFYVFPDPNKHGDIGNNKSLDYPLVYEYKLDSYIKNLSSGYAKNDPLAYISATTWNTYYSTQDRDFILDKNKEYNYSFTSLANKGIITDYQKDIFGNEYGLFKSYREDDNNIYVPVKFNLPEITYEQGGSSKDLAENGIRNILFNGGYFSDPRVSSGNVVFPYNESLRLASDYIWTTLKLKCTGFNVPDSVINIKGNTINLGNFSDIEIVQYNDHFSDIPSISSSLERNKVYTTEIIFDNFSSQLETLTGKNIIKEDKTYYDINNEAGILYIKEPGKYPLIFDKKNIKHYALSGNILLIELENEIIFYELSYSSGLTYNEIDSLKFSDNEIYKILYNESEESFIIAVINQISLNETLYSGVSLKLHRFRLNNKYIEKDLIDTENDISTNDYNIDKDNFEYITAHGPIEDIIFSYNNELDTYILAYLLNNNSKCFIYQHQFRIFNKSRFYNTLKSDVIYTFDDYTDDNFKYNFLINHNINTTINNSITFFVENNG